MEEKNTIGKYEIIEKCGEGGMGKVYKALDPDLNRYVAIKIINKDKGNYSSDWDTRFKNEAQSMALLSHCNIVAIYEYEPRKEMGGPFICMEFVDGNNLEKRQKKEQFTLEQSLEIMSELLTTLEFAHQKGVLHRDIKPNNIFITNSGVVKVTDFGIARKGDPSITQTGQSLGSPGYRSPEQNNDAKNVDCRTDIFPAGLILYELLTGKKVFNNFGEIDYNQLKNLPKISKINPKIGFAFDTVVQKAWEKELKNRFQSAKEFSEALHKAYKKYISKRKNVWRLIKAGVGLGLVFSLIILSSMIFCEKKINDVNGREQQVSDNIEIPSITENIKPYGLLDISTDKPGFEIYINGEKQPATTPVVELKIPAGVVEIKVVDPTRGIERSYETTISPNEPKKIGKEELNL